MELLKTLTVALYVGTGLWLNAAAQCLDYNGNIIKPPPTEISGYFAAGETLQQVIIPQMYFKCHGNITSWSALTIIKKDPSLLQYLTHQLTFTVWRPREGNKYDLVGENLLEFEVEKVSVITQIDNSSGLIHSNIGYFRFNMKEPAEQITFQPGDVLGWNVHGTTETIRSQLSVVYRKANSQDTGAVDLLSLEANTKRTYCSVLQCETTQSITSVIPYFSIQYDTGPEAGSKQTQPTCFERDQPQCLGISPASTLDDASLCPGQMRCATAGPTSAPTYYIAAGGTAAVLLPLLIVVVAMVTCVSMRKRMPKKEMLEINPTYESTDFRFECHENPVPSSDGNSCIYAMPDEILHSKTSVAIEGDCYASTYQTNGEIHFYQELSETNPRARTMAASLESVSLKSDLPLRMTMSSASLSRCELIVPTRPAPAYTEVVKNTSRRKTLGCSCSNTGRSVVSLPQTPEMTTSEREDFEGTVDSIYSKLKHPHKQKNPDGGAAGLYPTTELYSELGKRSYREIQRQLVSTIEHVGEGHFRKVHKGILKVPRGELEVAIETLNSESPSDERAKFLKEASIMAQCSHPNVVKLLGVVSAGRPLMAVVELVSGRDLGHYLRKLRDLAAPVSKDLPFMLLSFCRQVGLGIRYLASEGLIHRNLEVKNVLVTEDLMCKIGGFGMARCLQEDISYFSQGKLPPKWSAPESLKHNWFSSTSDVWCYGMLLFEIWSLGRNPFEGMLTKRVRKLVHSGYCQPPPPGCPRAIYQLMVQCWHTVPGQRITFANICSYLDSSNDKALLVWTTNDLDTLPRAAALGAPLMEARKLYLDLQYTYSNVSSV